MNKFIVSRTHFLTPILLAAALQIGQAATLSFTGNITRDDDVRLINFTLSDSSLVTLKTLSYAGGINGQGQVIARGGFDPILTLFSGSGAKVGQNSDGTCQQVAADAVTGSCWDSYLATSLLAGTYTVAITEYDNFASGNTLGAGFDRAGEGNFTGGLFGPSGPFWDFSGNQRDSHWALDVVQSPVPEPSSFVVVGSVLAIALVRFRKLVRQ